MTPIEQASVRNRLLAALPPEDFDQLAKVLQPVSLTLKQVLFRPDERIESVWFPESGFVSILAHLAGGERQEVGLAGREGMAGLPVVLGSDFGNVEALIQMSGEALRLPAAALKEAFEASAGIRRPLLRYMLAFHSQVTQTAACSGRHPIEGRLARWLLMTHDRAGSDTFPMTQEFMAMMLGVRRAGVSNAASSLQKAGVIAYDRGQMTILDRRHLEATSCECYRLLQKHFACLLQ